MAYLRKATPMQRMSGIDPMFIYSETAVSPMEVAYACVFDPATAPHSEGKPPELLLPAPASTPLK